VSLDVIVPWFLWSIFYPGGGYSENDIHATPIHEYKNQEECEIARIAYRVEVDKAHPEPEWTTEEIKNGQCRIVTWPRVKLVCSPINPKP